MYLCGIYLGPQATLGEPGPQLIAEFGTLRALSGKDWQHGLGVVGVEGSVLHIYIYISLLLSCQILSVWSLCTMLHNNVQITDPTKPGRSPLAQAPGLKC